MRTKALLTLAAVALATSALAVQKKKTAVAPPPPKLDLSKPEDVVTANRKLHSSTTDGKPVIYDFWGKTYSRVPGERDRLLFTWHAMNIRASKSVVDEKGQKGYRMVSREVVFYQDPATGEVLRKWKNPWTGKEVEVLHVANDPVNQAPMFPMSARGPATWAGVSKNGQGTLAFEVPLFYKNPLAGEYQENVGGYYHATEMFLFYYRDEELLDPKLDTINVQVGWTRLSSWLPWMEMAGRAGELYFHGTGLKIQSYDQLSEVTRKEIEANYPIYKTPPDLDDNRPNETSWTYFKKVMDTRKK
jgi:Protein of unknown function (DUF1838)